MNNRNRSGTDSHIDFIVGALYEQGFHRYETDNLDGSALLYYGDSKSISIVSVLLVDDLSNASDEITSARLAIENAAATRARANERRTASGAANQQIGTTIIHLLLLSNSASDLQMLGQIKSALLDANVTVPVRKLRIDEMRLSPDTGIIDTELLNMISGGLAFQNLILPDGNFRRAITAGIESSTRASIRSVPMTTGLAGVITLGFLFEWLVAGGGSWSVWSVPDIRTLVRAGGLAEPLVNFGETWRTITSAFVHIGIGHLIMNLLVLTLFGRFIERSTGGITMLCVFATGTLGASILSLYGNASGTISAGASGGVMALVVFAFANLRLYLPTGGQSSFSIAAISLTVIGILPTLPLVGSILPIAVDGWGHLGGAIVGGVLGIILIAIRLPRGATARRNLFLCWRSLAGIIFGVYLLLFLYSYYALISAL